MTLIAKILTISIPLALAGALIHESRNVERLRNDVRQLQSQHGESPTTIQEVRQNTRFSREDRERARREKERLARLEAAADESIRQQKAEYAANPPLIAVVRIDGRLSNEAIQRLSLTSDEIEALGKLIRRVRTDSDHDFVSRLKLMSSTKNNDGSETYSYYARARADRGKAHTDSLASGFEATLGKQRAHRLMEGVQKEDFIGALGKYDMDLEFTRKPNGSGRVKYQFRSPKTGEACRLGETDLDQFQREFGNVVPFPGAE